ncbi:MULTISPECIES: NAD(P)-dependent oxidoreductase [unclassified Fusibacter]|uniref:NAD(P)-dependent oxidoreductase n=1 Tax=unclassified Fusibacter TaxID=2624464 RepID=UPI001011862F|nr:MULTISPECIES: NAD(P)-dependent oxidoreductase [unclassified Fusibacter]MCK8058441.1 NAD(P)-binding domain-containing protein [Fusibacter sp. A2]NPE22791.1 hydroxyacid dehydrogenase [Fusibacter sp. A1]RXV60347.1 hydroxyacid dehydrogenase [Fusibacter sp. A1]
MKIKLLEPLGVEQSILDDLFQSLKIQGHEIIHYNQIASDEAEMVSRCSDADILIIGSTPLSDKVILNAKKLKMISVAFTGIDHVGHEHLKEQSILVSNSAGYSNDSVSELVLGLTLNLYRNISAADEVTRNGGTIKGLIGNEIKGKTVGIIGTGQIGLKTASIFKSLGSTLIAYDPYINEAALQMGVNYMTIDEVMSLSDIITLHLPLIDATKNFINRDKLDKMKPSAILINCARGPIVDNNALAEALNNGKIAGAGIDVYDMEPPIPHEYPLLHAKNTLFTPHVAYATQESMVKRAEIAIQNVIAFLEGKPQNIMT